MNLSSRRVILSQTIKFRLFQTEKKFADDNSDFDENGRQFSKRVENTVRKGEIARNEQFLLFPKCFQKICTEDTTKQGLYWKGLNYSHGTLGSEYIFFRGSSICKIGMHVLCNLILIYNVLKRAMNRTQHINAKVNRIM